jgi:LytS/YehU family sensor histidine kinase
LQYKLLKQQLSPHFLFNSLNTISSLIYKEEHICQSFIHRFAQLFKKTLDLHQKNLIPIEREIAFLENYLFLLKIRFEDSFMYQIELSEQTRGRKIPPFTLQLLAENAVKHNQLSIEKPLQLIIKEDDAHIIVSNEIIPKSQTVQVGNSAKAIKPNKNTQIGIENIKNRFSHYTKAKIEISRDQHFIVKLPKLELYEG